MSRDIQKRFSLSKKSKKLEKLIEKLAKATLEGYKEEEYQEIWNEISKEEQRLKRDFLEKYPPNPPNTKSEYAGISGILIENSSKPTKGDLRHCLSWGNNEEIYIWTHTKDEYSGLISKVTQDVKNIEPYWKTFGSALRCAFGLATSFERIWDFEYEWIYNFEPKATSKQQDWLNEDELTRNYFSGTVKSIKYFYEISPILQLLLNDDTFYIASQNLITAIENHWFCQICALQKPENRTHKNHDPTLWEVANEIPKMEVAIVQATRSVEAILGKPGNREKESKLYKMKQKWIQKLDIDPEDTFVLTEKSFLDYYYDLFEIRGSAAHSLGKMDYKLKREKTIQAQSFSWLILLSYFRKNALDEENAAKALNFNLNLLSAEDDHMSTKLTKRSQLEKNL